MADTPRVTVPVEDLAGKLKAIRDKFLMPTPDKDFTDYAIMTRCIEALSAAPAPKGGAAMRACADFQEAIDDFESEVADVMAEGSERADLWDREITVNIDALKTVMSAALATREEAPAEAGERDAEAIVRRWANWIIDESSDMDHDDHDAGKRKVRAERDFILSALRAQPQAREEAQPVSMRECLHCGRLKVMGCRCDYVATPPAPEAEKLRVAVEALKPFAAACLDRESQNLKTLPGGASVRVTLAQCRAARKALAALQAEQGAK